MSGSRLGGGDKLEQSSLRVGLWRKLSRSDGSRLLFVYAVRASGFAYESNMPAAMAVLASPRIW